MTTDEVIDLLTLMVSFDRRTVGEADVAAWALAVGDLAYGDAQEAVVRHYRDRRDFLMPADIRVLVKSIRNERVARSLIPAPSPELADNPAAYKAALAASVRRAADGELPAAPELPAIAGSGQSERRGGQPAALAQALTETRAALAAARRQPQDEGEPQA